MKIRHGAHYKNGEGKIYRYLLIEFQSSPDTWMALRALVHVGLLYQQLIEEGLEDIEAGSTIPHEQLKAEFLLK